jgi:hypothetical protein
VIDLYPGHHADRDRFLDGLPEPLRDAAAVRDRPDGLPSLRWRSGLRTLDVHFVGSDEVHCGWDDNGPGQVASWRLPDGMASVFGLIEWCLEGT